jgi:hypothetical protein
MHFYMHSYVDKNLILVKSGCYNYKALTELSLLRVPHFLARRGVSLKDLHPDTTFTSKDKCFLVT